MILVETEVKNSEIGGLGVFAVEFISIGSLVWEFHPLVDKILDRQEVLDLPEVARKHMRMHSLTNEEGNYQLSLDNNQYVNHSSNPNLIWYAKARQFIAVRNIEKGEELTKDYTSFSQSAFAKSLINKSI